jgi:hypothetical protein
VELEIVHAIAVKGGRARLFGGRAVALLCKDKIPPELKRDSLDIDLFILRRDRKIVTQVLKELGCAPEAEFNLLNGNQRLIFHHYDTKIDIFIDSFRMSHEIELAGRIAEADVTLSPTDLLLTKLQVAEINPKDMTDVAALFLALPLDPSDRLGLDPQYLARCLAKDWGLWRTSTMNLAKTRESAPDFLPRSGNWLDRLNDVISTIEERIANTPKSLKWRSRAIIGERMPWFERPEEPDIRHTPTHPRPAGSGAHSSG